MKEIKKVLEEIEIELTINQKEQSDKDVKFLKQLITILIGCILEIEYYNAEITSYVDAIIEKTGKFKDRFEEEKDDIFSYSYGPLPDSFYQEINGLVQTLNTHFFNRGSELKKFNAIFQNIPEEFRNKVLTE